MTDTTDTAALREFLMEQIDHADSYGGKVWLCAEDARLAMSSLDQLEAERQRADDNSAECHRQASEVGRIKHDLNKAEAEITALKVKLANPVVLPERKKAEFYVDEEFSNKDLAAIYNAASLEFKVKILNAGFTVKGDL